jgi:hypothetical protein
MRSQAMLRTNSARQARANGARRGPRDGGRSSQLHSAWTARQQRPERTTRMWTSAHAALELGGDAIALCKRCSARRRQLSSTRTTGIWTRA